MDFTAHQRKQKVASPYPIIKKPRQSWIRHVYWAAYRHLLTPALAHRIFLIWWGAFKSTHSDLPTDLVSMLDYYYSSEASRSASKYWHYLGRRNIKQLARDGYANFKQTVAKNYFYFGGDFEKSHGGYVYQNLREKVEGLDAKVDLKQLMKKHQMLSLNESIPFNLHTMLLYFYIHEEERGREIVEALEEPMEGNPLFITMDGKRLTQDLMNSIIEYEAVEKGCDMAKVRTVLELGSGSGRTSFTFLSLNPKLKYIISDIPPALYIAQTYLSNVFSDRRVFKFRPFDSFQEIEAEFNDSDLIFLTPDQLQMLPDNCVDLFMAIDCLHEMRRKTVSSYFDLADRLASRLYFKCWEKTNVRFDNDSHEKELYPVKESWDEVFNHSCEVPHGYFEALYEIT